MSPYCDQSDFLLYQFLCTVETVSAAHDLRDGHADDAQVRKRIRALLCLDMAAL